jgi:hypothetical protein
MGEIVQVPVHRALHPPYSPDLVPSDIFLSGYLKRKMLDLTFDSPAGLLDSIKEQSEKVPFAVLRVFLATGSFMLENASHRKRIIFLKTR